MTRFVSGEEEHDVVVRTAGNRLEVVVDGRAFRPDVAPAEPGVFVLRQEERVETFHCVRRGDTLHLSWRGAAYRLTERREGAAPAQRHVAAGVEAPMPGKVIAVHVEVGQRVAKGDEILVVEAMKMENAVRAPRGGTVKAIVARVGDRVSPGVVLVELE